MSSWQRSFVLSLIVLAFGACATVPTGPSVMVLPPVGKPFDQFQAEDAMCRQWARERIGLSPQEAVNQNTLTGAAVGTAVGAGLGAASGNAGAGAAIGAGSGLLVGTVSGANAGQVYGEEAQRRYDISYEQCMYANGNIIPGVRYVRHGRRMLPPPPPPDYDSPPPGPQPPPMTPPPPAP